MRVLLISANTETKDMQVLPLGMACVGAAVRNAGHDVKMLNLMACHDTGALIRETIGTFHPEVIGISVRNIDDQSMTNKLFMLAPVKKVVSDCRQCSKAPIVLGGAGYSIFPERALSYLEADIGIRGAGESAFTVLLEGLRQAIPIADLPGVFLPNHPSKNSLRKRAKPKLYTIPLPDDLEPPEGLVKEDIWMPFQTRRGCPLNCLYCSTAAIEGRIIGKLPPEHVVRALSQYVEAGFDRFFFVDNTFNLPMSYAKTLCDLIADAKLKISWLCILYPGYVDGELIRKMARAGCRQVAFGFESGSPEMLRVLNKRFQPDDIRRASKMLKENGITRFGFLLFGGPGETQKTVEQSLHFADSLGLEGMRVTAGIRIFPETPLHRIALKEGVVRPEDNILFPTFYLAPEISDWLPQITANWINERPNWIT